MQSASANFIAAEAAAERRPIYRIRVDWDANGYGGVGTIDDIDAQVESFTISREVKTDLPENVTLISGRSSASATITIGAGDTSTQAKTATWYYSEDNTASPLFGKPRQFRPVKIEVGFITASGPEYLTLFTGRTRDVQVDGSSGQVTIECLDASELFRGDRALPNVVADDQLDSGGMKPGLNGSWLIDWALRRVGYYTSPPARAGAKVLLTMHGSSFPEIGDMSNHFSGIKSPFNFEAGQWLEGLIMGGIDTTKIETFTVSTAGVPFNFRMDPTRTISIEGWVKVGSTVTDRGVFGIFSGTNGCGLFLNTSGPLAVYQKTPNAAFHIQNTALDPTDGNWHYVAVSFVYGSNTVATTVRMDGTSQSLGTPAGFNNTTGAPMPAMSNTHTGKCYNASGTLKALLGTIQDVQFSEEDISSTGFNNGFTPTAVVGRSVNKMLAVPRLSGTLWDAMETVAEAEFGVLVLDEQASPTFYTRDSWEAAPFDTVQMTLTTTTAVKSLVTNNPVDAIRNWIKVGGVVPVIEAESIVWQAGGRIRIPASGENIGYGNGVRTFAVGYDGPIYNLDTTFIYASTIGLTESAYRANRNIDGSGADVSNLSFAVTPYADHAFITVTNPNAFEAWLVNGTVASPSGEPKVVLYGQKASFDQSGTSSKLMVDKRDATSWTNYGQQLLELTDNPARQDLDAFDTIADSLLAQLKDPTRILRSLPIVGRPRLQLGDRVRITDTGGTALDGEFRVTKLETSLSRSGGLTQVIDVRTAS